MGGGMNEWEPWAWGGRQEMGNLEGRRHERGKKTERERRLEPLWGKGGLVRKTKRGIIGEKKADR